MKNFPGFAQAFQIAFRDLQLYSAVHPRAVEATKKAFDSLSALLAEGKKLQVAISGGRLLVNREPADRTNLQVAALVRQMEERKIYGLLFTQGVSQEELQALLGILVLKPQRVEELGGFAKLFEEKKPTHIRLLKTRFEEVGEDEDLVAVKDAVALAAQVAAGGPSAPATAASPAALVRGMLASLGFEGVAPVDLSGLAPFFAGLGLEGQATQGQVQGLLREGLGGLAPAQTIGLLRGLSNLDSGPIRQALLALAGETLVPSLVAAYAQGAAPKSAFLEAAHDLLPAAADRLQAVEALRQGLRQEGLKEQELEELLEVLTWAERPTEDRIAKLLEGHRIFEMPRDWVLAFLRELLESGQFEEFGRILRHYGTGLDSPMVARRLSVAEDFERITSWVPILGMPADLLGDLSRILAGHYRAERDPEVHRWTQRSFETLLGHWIDAGELVKAHAELGAITTPPAEGTAPWKQQANAELLDRLGNPQRLEKLTGLVFQRDRESAAAEIHPLLSMLRTAPAFLADRLAHEQDRSRRGRLVEALKATGGAAAGPLKEALGSPEWFVVRNALNLLGELGDLALRDDVAAVVQHGDPRVRRAAVRALWKLGGKDAEASIVGRLSDPDLETQIEALFCLGEMKSKDAVHAVQDLLRPGRWLAAGEAQQRLRERAAETLGQIGSTAAIPALAELLKRKGLLGGYEPAELRVAAAKALRAIGTAEALDALTRAADEAKGEARAVLQKILEERR